MYKLATIMLIRIMMLLRVMLMKIWLQDSEEECGRCRVALAAAQDGLCLPGEQLLVTPAGYGECGCIQNPVHVVHPLDNRCHPLYYQGPCDAGFMVRWSDLMGEVSCQPGQSSHKWLKINFKDDLSMLPPLSM